MLIYMQIMTAVGWFSIGWWLIGLVSSRVRRHRRRVMHRAGQ